MREINFRAWDKENGFWINIDSIVLGGDGSISYLAPEEGDMPPYLEDEVELMQYTGLNDVNDNPIYEGDIVNVSWPLSKLKGRNHAIGYSEVKDGRPVSEAIDWYEDVSRLLQTHDNGGQITVVGNCFENPELLGAGL